MTELTKMTSKVSIYLIVQIKKRMINEEWQQNKNLYYHLIGDYYPGADKNLLAEVSNYGGIGNSPID